MLRLIEQLYGSDWRHNKLPESKEESQAFSARKDDGKTRITRVGDNRRQRSYAIELLLEILDSGNQNLINAILANLEAFSGAVRNEKRQKQEIEDLKRRIEALEQARSERQGTPQPESNAA